MPPPVLGRPPPPPPPARQPPRRRRPSTQSPPDRDDETEIFSSDADTIIENNIDQFRDTGDNSELCDSSIDTILTMRNRAVNETSRKFSQYSTPIRRFYTKESIYLKINWCFRGLLRITFAKCLLTVLLRNDETYVFKGRQYWKLTDTAVAEGYPRDAERDWGLPGRVDAAFTWTNGKMYFFKGNRYWRFSPNKRLDKVQNTQKILK